MRSRLCAAAVLSLVLGLLGSESNGQTSTPPAGFTAIFNGKDLQGWHGMPHFDPRKLAAMDEAERKKTIDEWTADAKKHWTADNGDLVNDGNGTYLTTDSEFGDIELLIDYKTVAKADSGIYVRATPQIQTWDTTKEGGQVEHSSADMGQAGQEQQPWHARQGSPRARRQTVRRMEPPSNHPGRGSHDRLSER